MPKRNTKYQAFIFEKYEYIPEDATLLLSYSFDEKLQFTEKYIFSSSPKFVDQSKETCFNKACELLHLISGISYYKAFLPREIKIKNYSLTFEQASFFNKLYTNGLGEFFYCNQLEIPDIKFPFENNAKDFTTISNQEYDKRVLVPIGGGKDSLATLQLLQNAKIPFSTYQLGDFARINTVCNLIDSEHLKVKRIIDTQLFELNKQGAYNGHVPISAIIAGSLVVSGFLYNRKTAILSNEHSANFENLEYLGHKINHQYSKSLEFENDLSTYIKSFISYDFQYFSLLRPLSELSIAQIFSRTTTFDHVFSSCNKNFSLTKNELKNNWCLECPKCLSTFICLAPFCTPTRLVSIFGDNLLEQEKQIPLIEELAGIKKHKPFECVLDINEARATLKHLTTDLLWQDCYIIKWFKDLKISNVPELSSFLDRNNPHSIPKEYLCLLEN